MKLTDYLSRKGIRYRERGENVGKNWIGLNCVWCSDSYFHLGVHLSSGMMSCFRCGRKGHVRNFIAQIEGNYSAAKAIVEQFDFVNEIREVKFGDEKALSNLLKDFVSPLPLAHRKYLESRRFDPSYIERKYQVMAANHHGKFKFRVIIPVIMNHQVVSFIGRDITDRSPLRYKNLPDEKSLRHRKEILYNVDNVTGTSAIVVEGTTDVWRIGDGAVATLTTSFSKRQVETVANLGIKNCFIMYDSEKNAQDRAEKLAKCLAPFINHVEIVTLDDGRDPADLTEKEVRELRRDLL